MDRRLLFADGSRSAHLAWVEDDNPFGRRLGTPAGNTDFAYDLLGRRDYAHLALRF